MLNKTLLIGNLTQDATTHEGNCPRTTLRVATHRWWYKDGRPKQATEFHQVVLFGAQAERTSGLTSGTKIFIEGRIQTRSWDADGTTRYITEIVGERFEVLRRVTSESS